MRKTLTQWLVQFRAGDVKKCCNVWEHMYMYKLIGRPVATSRPPRRRRMLGYRCPTQQANQFQVVHWREVLATTLKDTKLIRGANFWHQGSRKDRGEELADGAGSHLMYGGRQGSCFVRVWEWVEKDVCQKMCSWGEHRLALACAQECCWGWLTTTGAPHCAPDLLVHRQNPGERETCLQLPCHSCPFTNSQVNYLQRQEFPQFVIVSNSSKNVWFLIHYFVLQCCKAWPLNLSHSFCNNYPTLSVGRLKTQRILSVLCNVVFSTSQQKPDRLMITPLGKRR